ncbi:MAG: transcription antitermination factor NusB [Oscillospiraceae bacterium]
MSSPDPRYTAAKCLMRVEGGGYSNLVLDSALSRESFPRRDADFLTALFYGTLEKLVSLDYFLSKWLKKGIGKLDPEVRVSLELGAYQCLYMDSVPARAAVDESVKLVKKLGKGYASGLVNAVLRRVSETGTEIPEEPRNLMLSVKYSIIPGLAEALERDYGPRAEEIMAGMGGRKPADIRINTMKISPRDAFQILDENGIRAEWLPSSACLRLPGSIRDAGCLPAGTWAVQSYPAQCAVRALELNKGMTVLDMCSAPGGKSLAAAEAIGGQGLVLACDNDPGRLELVKKAADEEGMSCIRARLFDSEKDFAGMKFQRVLCDVPCSGYGEICSKPELRLRDPSEAESLPDRQLAILENGARHLDRGGKLVYSTCTVLKKENSGVVEAFLSRHPEFSADELPDWPGSEPQGPGRAFLPGRGGPEGFYVARLGII